MTNCTQLKLSPTWQCLVSLSQKAIDHLPLNLPLLLGYCTSVAESTGSLHVTGQHIQVENIAG